MEERVEESVCGRVKEDARSESRNSEALSLPRKGGFPSRTRLELELELGPPEALSPTRRVVQRRMIKASREQ